MLIFFIVVGAGFIYAWKIGALEWDATGVVLELGRLSGVARSRFVARFERAFQKGGG